MMKCKYGHEFTPENTYIYMRRKGTACRACRRAAAVKDYYKKLGKPIPERIAPLVLQEKPKELILIKGMNQ